MPQPFTPNLLVKLLYRETSAAESSAVTQALRQDPALVAEYQGLLKAFRQLPKVSFRPSGDCLRSIMTYSEETALEKQY